MGPHGPQGSGVPGPAPPAVLAWLTSCVQSPRVSPVELGASPGLYSVAATLTASSVSCHTLCLPGPSLTPTPPLGAAAELNALLLLVGCTGLRPAGACLAQGGSQLLDPCGGGRAQHNSDGFFPGACVLRAVCPSASVRTHCGAVTGLAQCFVPTVPRRSSFSGVFRVLEPYPHGEAAARGRGVRGHDASLLGSSNLA